MENRAILLYYENKSHTPNNVGRYIGRMKDEKMVHVNGFYDKEIKDSKSPLDNQ
jgi:hypothetical protein